MFAKTFDDLTDAEVREIYEFEVVAEAADRQKELRGARDELKKAEAAASEALAAWRERGTKERRMAAALAHDAALVAAERLAKAEHAFAVAEAAFHEMKRNSIPAA